MSFSFSFLFHQPQLDCHFNNFTQHKTVHIMRLPTPGIKALKYAKMLNLSRQQQSSCGFVKCLITLKLPLCFNIAPAIITCLFICKNSLFYTWNLPAAKYFNYGGQFFFTMLFAWEGEGLTYCWCYVCTYRKAISKLME